MSEQPLITIAVGDSLDSKLWKNVTWPWDQFKNRCRAVERTPEPFDKYLSMSAAEQTAIKGKAGGYVGAELANSRRLKRNVMCRTMATLDADAAVAATWAEYKAKVNFAICVYSTHKHTDEKPRFRINIPFSREVRVDEYEAIARLISQDIGMEYLDHTGMDINRLMFWPTASADAPFFYDEVNGPFLDPDQVLARYDDWTDITQWPVHPNETKVIKNQVLTLKNPNDKTDFIGAFCRAFSWDEIFEVFLPEAYAPSAVPGRYSYLAGTTAAGLVWVDDHHVWSHHSSDPAAGFARNKFDLVRKHLYHDMDKHDEDEGPDKTPIEKRPSFIAMRQLCMDTPQVRAELAAVRMQQHLSDFADMLEGEEKKDPLAWIGEMEIDNKRAFLTSVKNIRLILENDPLLAGKIVFNEFTGVREVKGGVPWDKSPGLREWTDEDWESLRCYLGEAPYNLQRTPKMEDVMGLLKKKYSYHPVKDYLASCTWDGKSRINTVFIDYLGAENSEYVRQVTRKALIACVARIYSPGIKFDYAPMLVGPQGIGKSTIIEKLGGEWFSDAFDFHMLNNGGKQAIEQIQGVWIVEVGEMSGYKNIESKAAKRFLSAKKDKTRFAYGREPVTKARQCVFWPTSNERHPLTGSDGNRRFWVIDLFGKPKSRLSPFDISEDEVKQIWAEAMFYWHIEGEELYLSEEMEAEARKHQKSHESQDEREGLIRQFLELKLPENWESMKIYERQSYIREPKENDFGIKESGRGMITRDRVCAVEIWVELFEKSKNDMEVHKTRFIHEALKNIEGWEPYTGNDSGKERYNWYGSQKSYRRVRVHA